MTGTVPTQRRVTPYVRRTDAFAVCGSIHLSLTGGEVGLDPLSVGPSLQFFSAGFLRSAIVFFALALVAAVITARGIAGMSMTIAK
ncbi:DUF1328 domain-containing protein [Halobaculum rubrum]|nr:DUF1328 domain-containing protein [Halobaculum rubrum]